MELVDPKLYNILNKNETGLYPNVRTGEIIAYVHINLYDLSDFVQAVGGWHFDEGEEVILFTNTVCIEINDIISGFDHSLTNYKDCFDEDLWKEHEEEIIKEWDREY